MRSGDTFIVTAGVAHEIGPNFEPSAKPCLFFFDTGTLLWRGASVRSGDCNSTFWRGRRECSDEFKPSSVLLQGA